MIILCLPFIISGAAEKTPDEMVKQAKAEIKEVSAPDLNSMMKSGAPIVILDVRDRDEYDGGHIPGAVNISRGTLEFKVNMMLPDKGAKIIVYCGVDLRGPLATKTLNELGYKNAVNLKGGLDSWKEAGYPIQK